MSNAAPPTNAQPWRTWLEWFATPLAAALNELVRGLQPLLTPMRGRPQPGQAEPDGLDDLRRRGSYERLLPTEWLLAAELPDEFLRRAAAGEHLFFATRPRGERQRRRIVALFDAGPAQLGAPRLAHMALWILLSRRAELAGVELSWGLLQEPGTMYPARSAADLKLLLAGRSWNSVQEAHRLAWSAWLAHNDAGLAESWCIGPPAVASFPCSHSVRIANSLEDESLLEVALYDRAGRHAVALPLPPPTLAASLLGGHFEHDARPGVRLSGRVELAERIAPVFSPDGRYVAIAMKGLSGVAVFTVPRQRNTKAQEPSCQSWSTRKQIVGMLLNSSRAVGLLRDGDGLSFWQTKNLRQAPLPDSEHFAAPPGTAVWRSCFLVQPGQREIFFVHDAQRRLVAWAAAGPAGKGLPARGPTPMGQNVLAVAQADQNTLICLEHKNNMLSLRQVTGKTRRPPSLQISCSVATPPAYLAIGSLHYGASDQGVPVYACAVRITIGQAEVWQLYLDRNAKVAAESQEITLQAGERGVGVVCRHGGRGVGLVVLAPNRRQFYLDSGEGRETIYASTVPVSRVTVCPTSGDMAVLGSDGRLVVYALHEFGVRLDVSAAARDEIAAESSGTAS